MTSKFFSCWRWSWKSLCVFTKAQRVIAPAWQVLPYGPLEGRERCSWLVPGSLLAKCPPPSFLPGLVEEWGQNAMNTAANGMAHRRITVPLLLINLPLGVILSHWGSSAKQVSALIKRLRDLSGLCPHVTHMWRGVEGVRTPPEGQPDPFSRKITHRLEGRKPTWLNAVTSVWVASLRSGLPFGRVFRGDHPAPAPLLLPALREESQPLTGSIPLYGMPALHPDACTPARAISQGKDGLLLLIPLKAARAAQVPELHPGSSPGLRPRPFCLSCVLTTQPPCLCSNPPSSLPWPFPGPALCPAGPLTPASGFPALVCAALCSHVPPQSWPPGPLHTSAPVLVDSAAPQPSPCPALCGRKAFPLLTQPKSQSSKASPGPRVSAQATAVPVWAFSCFLYFLSLFLQQIRVCLTRLCVLST